MCMAGKQVLGKLVKAEVRRILKKLLEEIALVKKEVYCEKTDKVGNGFYPHTRRVVWEGWAKGGFRRR